MTDQLKLTPPNVCPSCGQRLKETRQRVCGTCQRPILRGHKFTFDGSTVRHRNCADPTARTKVGP